MEIDATTANDGVIQELPPGPDWTEVRRRLEELREGKAALLDGEQVLSERWARLREKGVTLNVGKRMEQR